MIGRITKVRKRDGRLVDFDESKIADAIHKAGCAVGRENRFLADELAGVVTLFLEKRFSGQVPGIEDIQDMVEKVLIETGHARMAKAYILYRERRARAREQVRVHGEPRSGPQVGNPGKARISPWSKARITRALVREADLDERVAADLAASVERKVMDAGVDRITTSVIRSLVEAELFDRGFGDRVGRQALVGLPRYDVDRLLRGATSESAWRASGPSDLKRSVAEAVLAQYALSEIYGTDVVDAHLEARLHVLDVGSPFEWVGAVATVPAATEADAWVDACASLAGRLSGVVTRELTLGGLVPDPCVWCADGRPGATISAARRLLSHSALRVPAQGGSRLRMVLSLPVLPADESAALLAEGIVREHWARFRSGHVSGLPSLVLRVSAEAVEEARGRRALLPILAAGAETGRVHIRFDRDEAAGPATPWFRLPAADADSGAAALPVRGAVAVNVAAVGAALDEQKEERLLEEFDRILDLAVSALSQKRSFMASMEADPSGPLYRVAAGAHPLLDDAHALDLVHLVGVSAAARRLEREPAGVRRLAGRLRSYAAVRLADEGRKARLRVQAAPDRDGEAAHRFFEADRARDTVEPEAADYADLDPYSLPREIPFPDLEAQLDPITGTLALRFPRDDAPAPEALYDGLCLLARDPRVGALRLTPWPDRSVRPGPADE